MLSRLVCWKGTLSLDIRAKEQEQRTNKGWHRDGCCTGLRLRYYHLQAMQAVEGLIIFVRKIALMNLGSLFWSIKMMTDLPCCGCSVTPTLAS